MAAYSEITLEQYADFSTTITVDDTQGDSVNLSGYSVSSQMRKSPYSSTYFSFDAEVTNYATGLITISMDSSTTANLSPGRYMYDVVIISESNTKTRVVEGIVSVLPGVTR